jgi:tetratricopeptide (TPR) repeat protein
LIPILYRLVDVCQDNHLLSQLARDKFNLPLFEEIIALLRPWSTNSDPNFVRLTDEIDKGLANYTLPLLSRAEVSIALIQISRNEFDLAENHCQQALSYAKQFDGKEEIKADLLCKALRRLYQIRRDQGNDLEALTYAEEMYNCVAIIYNPVHPEVQEAASTLIECLIFRGDFDHAETFAEMTLDSLKDPANGLDQQSEAVAKGYYNLANVINQQSGDREKAEVLIRESLRIRTRLYCDDHFCVGMSADLLADILQAQGKLGSETKELYERCLVNNIKNCGPEGHNTAVTNFNMGNFYYKRAKTSQSAETMNEHLLQSKSKYNEALRTYTKLLGPDNSRTVEASSRLSFVTHMLSEL